MDTRVDAQLLCDIDRYRLRFECEHCAHFDPSSEGCGEGFPNAMHRERPLVGERHIVFCKSFELT